MAGVTVTLTGESAKLWGEIEKVVAAQKKMEGGLAEITRQSARPRRSPAS